ncbi:biotin--[acetyl-CoA-carboxylase] ligase [Algoriphagus namhaensis]
MYKILANTIFLGKDVHFLPECHSTNDTALQMIKKRQLMEGSIVITAHQTRGKGQRGNSWTSEKGKNLTFSIVLRPGFLDISEQFYLNMMVSNALRRILSEYLPDLKVKWPNDLVVPESGKLGGILIENIFGSEGWEYAVTGIGLNINQTENLPDRATSMKLLTGSTVDLVELFGLLVTQLEQSYLQLKKKGVQTIREEFIYHLFHFEEWKEYQDQNGVFEGKIVGVSDKGDLIMERRNGEKNLFGLKELRFLW